MKRTLHFEGVDLTVCSLPRDGQPRLATKTVSDASGFSYVTKKGDLVSSYVTARRFKFGADWQKHTSLLRAAIALGCLPKNSTQRLLDEEEAQRSADHAAWAARNVLDCAKEAGLALTPTQRRALVRTVKRTCAN